MNKRYSKLLAWLLTIVVLFCNVPTELVVRAAESDKAEVRVIIKNDILKKSDGAAWEGTLLDETVELKADSNALSVVVDALESEGYTVTGADSGYITEINGLKEKDDANQMGGFIGTINDWFANEGLTSFTVANGKLEDGDEICMMYSCAWGADIGSDWSSTSTKLSSVLFSEGILSQTFEADTFEYTLNIPEGTTELQVTPTAENKNFQVKTYKNEYQPFVSGAEYKRSEAISVAEGDTIYIGVGYTDETDASKNWQSMNSGHKGSLYTFHIRYATEVVEKPTFESFDFMTSALSGWTTDTFSNDIYEYDVNIKAYSTSTLTIQTTTKFDEEKYSAKAYYTDLNGEEVETEVASGKITYLRNIPFGMTDVKIVLADRTNLANSATYTFHVSRPYDTTATLNSTKGMVISPEGRSLLSTLYMDKAEGTLFALDEDGEITSAGMTADGRNYKAFVLEGLKKFAITLTGKTSYVHIRISEDGTNYTEVTSGGNSPVYEFGDKTEKKLTVQTISDEEYTQNGFANVAELGETYTLTVVQADIDTEAAKILIANTETGDWYPAYSKDNFSYSIVIENAEEFPELYFTVQEGAKVMLGSTELTADESGVYSLTLKTSSQTVKVEAENGIVNSYYFQGIKKSKYDVPDKVVDYLCINSQYTNASYGINPVTTLSGSLKSLGNWGGYITYYYEDAILDDPANKYGVDFYVYGNSFTAGGSAAESGQVWVSEDGENWYALAGSEHYEDSTITDYEITYTKTSSGKTAWTDNYGGSNDGTSQAGAWPNAKIYYMNDYANQDSITLKGILLPCENGTLYGDGSTASYAKNAQFGYVDYFRNETIGADVNPYAEAKGSNGFDLKWAVDETGNPVTFKNGIHYIKVVTASNIWAGMFGEKSTEVSTLVRTTKQEEVVGVTTSPEAIVLTDEAGETTTISLEEDKQSYTVKINDSRTVSLSVTGASEDANIYVNHTRIIADENVELEIGDDGRTVRLIVQEGEKEPVIYMLYLESESIETTNNIYEETTKALQEADIPTVNSVGGEWIVVGLARAGAISNEFKEGYYKNLYEVVKQNESAKLHRSKSTENARAVLALTALGYDVTNVAGYNLLEPLANMEYVTKQGINGIIWTLLAFDSANYEIPACEESGVQITRELLIETILGNQMENGAFALDGENADVDITSMAIQALTPYYEENEMVNAAITKALEYLRSVQNEDGSFGSSGASNAESTAQIVIALCGLQINPRTDSRFIQNGISVLSALNNFYAGDGAFKHIMGSDANQMATEQSYLALVSYVRMLAEQNRLYDMSDITIGSNPVITDSEVDNDGNLPSDGDNQNSNNNVSQNSNSSTGSAPKTGDETNAKLYVIMLFVTVTGFYACYKRYNRRLACKKTK